MNHFPASKSILSPVQLLEFFKKKYPNLKPSKCKLIKSWVNDTYLIFSDLSQYIFRVYRIGWRNEMEIQAEVDFLLLLKEKGISVSYPIADKAGKYLQKFNAIEGTRFGVLFYFAKGEKPTTNSNDLEISIGKLMASIHLNSQDLKIERIDYTLEFLLDHSIDEIGKRINQKSPEFLFLKKIQQYFYKEIKK